MSLVALSHGHIRAREGGQGLCCFHWTNARNVAVLGWPCACINGPQYIQRMLRNEKEIMGRKVTLKGEFWQKKWRPRRIPCRVQGLCWTSTHGSADNGGGGQSVLNNYLGFLFPGSGLWRWWALVKEPISVENLIKASPYLEPGTSHGWKAWSPKTTP